MENNHDRSSGLSDRIVQGVRNLSGDAGVAASRTVRLIAWGVGLILGMLIARAALGQLFGADFERLDGRQGLISGVVTIAVCSTVAGALRRDWWLEIEITYRWLLAGAAWLLTADYTAHASTVNDDLAAFAFLAFHYVVWVHPCARREASSIPSLHG